MCVLIIDVKPFEGETRDPFHLGFVSTGGGRTTLLTTRALAPLDAVKRAKGSDYYPFTTPSNSVNYFVVLFTGQPNKQTQCSSSNNWIHTHTVLIDYEGLFFFLLTEMQFHITAIASLSSWRLKILVPFYVNKEWTQMCVGVVLTVRFSTSFFCFLWLPFLSAIQCHAATSLWPNSFAYKNDDVVVGTLDNGRAEAARHLLVIYYFAKMGSMWHVHFSLFLV